MIFEIQAMLVSCDWSHKSHGIVSLPWLDKHNSHSLEVGLKDENFTILKGERAGVLENVKPFPFGTWSRNDYQKNVTKTD